MSKRIGANQRLKRNVPRKNSRNTKRGFLRTLAVIGKYGCRLILITGFILIIGFILFFGKNKIIPALLDIEIFKIKKIVVQGHNQIDSTIILSIAAIDTSLSLFMVPVKKIEDRLKTDCWIEEVNVKRRIPYMIRINIKERKPIAIVNLKNVFLIDKTGFLWPLKPHCYWDVPIVSGLKDSSISKNSPRLIDHDLKRMCRFINDIEKCENLLTNGITQINFRQEGVVSIKLASNPIIIMLNEFEVGRSIHNLSEILQRMENDSIHTTKRINLCYNNIAYIN